MSREIRERRIIRHEVLGILGPEVALILREVRLGTDETDTIPAFEVRIHGEPAWLYRGGSRGEAEAWFEGYLSALRRGYGAGYTAALRAQEDRR